MAGGVVSESVLTGFPRGAEGAAAAASFGSAGPCLVLTEPGAAFAEAGLTLKGPGLPGGPEQTEGRGADVSSVALADSGFTDENDKRAERGAINVDS